jgi:ectoine hydroxylase-related dioxygenase (phytanoyl-CoA dioxygenase family)
MVSALASPAAPVLSDADVASFRARGYLAVESLVPGDELEALRALYDAILADRQVLSLHFEGGGRIHQVLSPDLRYPALRETASFARARSLACRLLGIAERELDGFFTHLIYKPAGAGRDTPWHQDEAYWNEPDTRADSLSVWIPLDPVTVESGCMQFVPGSHAHDVLPHARLGGFPPLLRVEGVDVSGAVACPLPAGGATVHHCRTVHATGPNRADVERRAWSIAFHAPRARRERPLPRPWLLG